MTCHDADPAPRAFHRMASISAAIAAAASLPGCYERVVKVSDPRSRMSSYQPNVKDDHNAIDEAMYGPVPKGQDPDAYYRSKKQLLPPNAPPP